MKRTIPIIAALLIAVGVAGQLAPQLGKRMVGVAVPKTVQKAQIFYETKDKLGLPSGVKTVIEHAPKYNVMPLDWNVVGADDKTPEVLIPYLDACADRNFPKLVRKLGEGNDVTYEAQDCPDSIPEFEELIK